METKPQNNQNQGVRRNALIFAGITICIHIIACFMFGFYFRLPAQNTNGEFYPIFFAFAYGVFVIIGFGLLFSYLRKMLWTGMGFTLLITALTMEFYFMINAFWTKAAINGSLNPPHFADENKDYDFFLTNLNEPNGFQATITGGFRCALANLIAFSAIIGRAGPLESLFVVIFGTIGYELNRQILEKYTNDAGGTSSIFVFGGFFGLVIGLLRFLRERDETTSTKQHENYTASRSSATFALIGGILTWIFFPILAADYIDAAVSSSTPYTSLYSVIFAMSAATLTSFMVSPLFNNGLLIRDIIYGPVAGGVASVTASYWVVNPVYSIVIGVVSATIQVIVMNLIEKKFARENSIFNTYSFTLFGIQGLIGAIFAAIWDAGLRSNTYGFTYNFQNNALKDQVFSWVISLISVPMGALFGAGAGLFIFLVASHRREDHFDDFTYWLEDDGIRALDQTPQKQSQIGIRERSLHIKERQGYL